MANDQDDPNKNKPKRRIIVTSKPKKSEDANPLLPDPHEVVANPVTSEDIGIPIFKRPKASIKKTLHDPIPEAIKPKQEQVPKQPIPTHEIPAFESPQKAQKKSQADPYVPTAKEPLREKTHKPMNYFFNILSLIAVVGVTLLGFWVFSQHPQEAKIAEQERSFENTIAQLRANMSNQHEAFAQLEEKHKELTAILSEQNRRLAQTGTVNKWNVYEARYLTSLAIERLTALHDIKTALQLLKSADEKIKVMGDPRLMHVRDSLAQDMAILQNAPIVDISGLWAKTGALSNQLSNLSFIKPTISQEELPKNEDNSPKKTDSSDWRNSLYASWDEIKGLIRVREFDPKSFAAILSGKEQQQLLFNLKLLIEQARWAILQKNETIYKNSLTTLQQWLAEYFVKNENLQKLFQDIAQLQETSITTPLPQIHASLDAIDQYLNTQVSVDAPNEATP